MKTLILIVLVALTCVVRAQDSVSKEEWNRQYAESWALTSLLFPDMGNTDSPIYQKYKSILPNPQVYPRLAYDSNLPLFFSIHAARSLGVAPRWSALNDAQKQEVVDEIAYYSFLLMKTIEAQGQQLAAAYNSRPSGDTSFNPGGVEGRAGAMFNPQRRTGIGHAAHDLQDLADGRATVDKISEENHLPIRMSIPPFGFAVTELFQQCFERGRVTVNVADDVVFLIHNFRVHAFATFVKSSESDRPSRAIVSSVMLSSLIFRFPATAGS